VTRRSKLSLAPEQSPETKRVPGFEEAPPGAPEGQAGPDPGRVSPESPKPRAESHNRPAAAPKAKLPNTKRVLQTLAVVAAAAFSLYLLKRRFF
jgi:hypothetical protein